eukprot:CAMPEP_0175953044 /NCGR_PEP_ID=MMETSP0108-20121206/31109_1 /TAXON_ID=195067 ORGANISM="Goniomonas pacifica, Strain CCMP1869" /NCGR_SAMPLE_ID=MMETSP0108 /ASSEMBLY_ACC=CAM_ASM_000204 /LENGTH=47 /DNA_ID= /DNA_START= /DNA_END= /DNA_ORIENTATION=
MDVATVLFRGDVGEETMHGLRHDHEVRRVVPEVFFFLLVILLLVLVL